MGNFKKWEDLEKELNFTPEEDMELQLEMSIIKALIETRKNSNLTQNELSKFSGIIQPSIAKIENFKRIPQYTTLMKLLYPMGYTLSVVPINKENQKKLRK